MAGFTATEFVNATPQDVFDFMTNYANAPKLLEGVVSNEPLTDGPVGVGSRFMEKRVTNGKETVMELEVVTYDPPHRYAAGGTMMGITATYHYQLTSENGGTRVDLEAEVSSGLLMKLMLPAVVKQMQKQDAQHLPMLKSAVEAEATGAVV